MRPAVCLATLVLPGVLAGCSPLLGIEDPAPRRDGGDVDTMAPGEAGIDAAPDAPDGGSNLDGKLLFSLSAVTLDRHQTVRLHVQHMHGSSLDDVTDRATLLASAPAIATIGGPGQISSVSPGTTTITATLTGVAPATLDVTVRPAECHPVINEFATAGVNSADEWVEIYNPCTTTIDVHTWTLDYRAASAGMGAPDSNLMVALAGEMAPHELRLYTGVGYAGTDIPDGTWAVPASGIMKEDVGAIGLRAGAKDTGAIIDAVAYGGTPAPTFPFLESRATGPMTAGSSASRLPFDGKDDDDGGADFKISATALTPHALNAP